MPAILLLLVILLLFGLGFTVKVLWWAALVLLVLWIVGFLTRSSGARWYRW